MTIFTNRCGSIPGFAMNGLAGLLLVCCCQHAMAAEPKLEPLPTKTPAPKENPTTPDKVALGKLLFFDPRLSGDNSMSCATCHQSEKAFADGRDRSPGNGGKPLLRNTPTVLNAAFLPNLFWDGRAADLEAQALGPIENPDEMNQDLDELVDELRAVPEYREQFQKVFGGPITRERIGQALAAFQRTLVSGPSPVDRYLQGDRLALSDSARRGMQLFVGDAGCIRCHNGPLLTDGKFYRLGYRFEDQGRGAVTKEAGDAYKFRTPPLRNIADTAPYMHDGSLATLTDVVTFYYRGVPASAPAGQKLDIEPLLGQSFTEIEDLVAFLKALSGEVPKVEPRELP